MIKKMLKTLLRFCECFCVNTIVGYIEFKKMKKWKQFLQIAIFFCCLLLIFILWENRQQANAEDLDVHQTTSLDSFRGSSLEDSEISHV